MVITIWWTEQTIEQGGGAFGGYRLLKAAPGRARSTLELLADEMVRLTDHDELPF